MRSCRAGRRKRNAAARSGSSASRRRPSGPHAASACSSPSAGCSPSPRSRASWSPSLIGTGGGDGEPSSTASGASTAKIPEQQISDIKEAAKAAGCTLNNPAYEGANHEQKTFKASDYKTNPPTSGNHTPDWYEDGIYAPGDVPELGKLVHPLEHGRIEIQYKQGTPKATVDQLEALLADSEDGYHMLLFENTTGMEAAVAATAWTHSLTCPEMNDKVFDAIRTFRARYIDKGPERVP